MPWQQTTPMTERLHCIALYQTRLRTRTALGPRSGSSRNTGDQWRGRDRQGGPSGLQETPRTPRGCPHRIAPAIAAV